MLLELILLLFILGLMALFEWWNLHRSKQRRTVLEREQHEHEEFQHLVEDWNTVRHEAEAPTSTPPEDSER
jgi:hypothetical protein